MKEQQEVSGCVSEIYEEYLNLITERQNENIQIEVAEFPVNRGFQCRRKDECARFVDYFSGEGRTAIHTLLKVCISGGSHV